MPELKISVTVAYSPAVREVVEMALTLAHGSTVAAALNVSGLLASFPELAANPPAVGVWGKKVELSHVLLDQDRVEVYRALKVDPKDARRQRFVKQGAKKAGLFSKSRPGAKTGY